jgi:AcrR family transcriptional regulator
VSSEPGPALTAPDSGTKTRILDATWDIVGRRGRADITMKEVADAVGLSRQAVYLHFPNRAALLMAAVRHFDDRHEDREGGRQRLNLPPVEAFEAALRYWLDYLPRVLAVATALEAAALVEDEGAAAWHDRMRHRREALRPFVGSLATHGFLAPSWTVDRATDWVWARTHPSVWRHLVVEREWASGEFVDRLVTSLIAELVTRVHGT